LQVTEDASPKACIDSYEARAKAQKELVETLKAQWKLLWSERYSDKVRAEDVSVKDYTNLSVERGTIIRANRDFKALAFKEILQRHLIADPDRFVQPDSQMGGWNKFVKTKITNLPQKSKRALLVDSNKETVQQPKKGGRGWLHTT
jgi:hypothetical protein